MSRFISKILCLLCLLTVSCKDIPRDNILDPKNPSAYRAQKIAVEAFVNTNDSIPFNYNIEMLAALDQLNLKYPDQISVLEYHRNVSEYSDPFHNNDNDALYTKYTDKYSAASKGVPDVYINGTSARVQGAYDASGTTIVRLEDAIEPFLIENSNFTIEPDLQYNNNRINISARIARLGISGPENLLVKAIILKDEEQEYHRNVVDTILRSNISPRIDAGETRNISIGEYSITDSKTTSVVIMITSGDQLIVFQTKEAKIQ